MGCGATKGAAYVDAEQKAAPAPELKEQKAEEPSAAQSVEQVSTETKPPTVQPKPKKLLKRDDRTTQSLPMAEFEALLAQDEEEEAEEEKEEEIAPAPKPPARPTLRKSVTYTNLETMEEAYPTLLPGVDDSSDEEEDEEEEPAEEEQANTSQDAPKTSKDAPSGGVTRSVRASIIFGETVAPRMSTLNIQAEVTIEHAQKEEQDREFYELAPPSEMRAKSLRKSIVGLPRGLGP
jgi:hypothetical protein